MVYLFDGFNHFIRLNKDERLAEAMEHFMRDTPIDGAWLNVIGAVQEVTLGFYDLNHKQYEYKTFTGPREITGLQGNIAADTSGKPILHLHGTFADRNFAVIGGHVKDLTAGATVEIFVHRSYKPLRRAHNEAIGLPLLDLDHA